MNYEKKGCIMLARKIQESEIWATKPNDWLKIWIHILLEVNHSSKKTFERGEGFFNYNYLARDCRVKYNSVDNCISWLVKTGQLTKQKTTRGVVIKVLNYEKYQNLKNYKSDTKGDIESETKANQRQDKDDTINNNDKNVNNGKQIVNTIPAKINAGNPEINNLLIALKQIIGIEHFVDSKIERYMAGHCLGLIKKIGPNEFKRRLEILLSDSFQRKNCNKIKYLYNNIKGFIEPETDIVITS